MSVRRIIHKLNRRFPNLKKKLPVSVRRRLRTTFGANSELRSAEVEISGPSKVENAFVAAYRDEPIRANEVLYESFYGKSISCSPFAIFENLLFASGREDLQHTWAVAKEAAIPQAFCNHPRVRFVISGSVEYAQALATAGYVVTNSTFPTYYVRREGQRYINTWHGVPLKRMFKYESSEHFTVHRNSARNFLQTSHLLLPNEFTRTALLEGTDLVEAVSARVTCTGAPRVDFTVNSDRKALRAELGIPEGVKIVFVAPTYRGKLGGAEADAPMLNRLLARLGDLDPNRYAVFAQTHYFVGKGVRGTRTPPQNLTTNQFLSVVDVLISDYSSIMFDFFPTGRQVILYVYDRAEYEELRGLYFPLEDLPADICMRPDDVIAALHDGVEASGLLQFLPAKEKYFPLEDGRATERAVSAMFGDVAATPQKRARLLFYCGGWKGNGITSSILNLLRALAEYDLDIYVITEGVGLEKQPDRAANIRRIDPRVRIIHRAGGMLRDRSEDEIIEKFYSANDFTNADHESQLRDIFSREARRNFGDLEFDAAIDFSGYARFWSLLMGAVSARRHVIFQHNDMLAEAKQRFDVLNGVFNTYKWYDAIVSVTEGVRKLNLENVGQHYRSEDCAVAVHNMLDSASILQSAKADLQSDIQISKKIPTFITAARLSPEKAQDRAIRAIGLLRKEGIEVQLVIMGDGPLLQDLKNLASAVGVSDLVCFAGHVTNPFPAIAAADCFLLTSDYEGQGMVLLEAMTLGKPIISTDNPATRSVLGEGHGMLVPCTDEGVVEGMRRFLRGDLQAKAFNPTEYCDKALREFFSVALGFVPDLLPKEGAED